MATWLVEHSAGARGFTADTLARVAVIVALNGHGMTNPVNKDAANVTALFEISSKFAHSCDPNATWDWDKDVLTHKMIRAVAPGEVVTVDYYGGGCSAHSTAVRRHRLMRGKFFMCHCSLCSAPDALAALPCPTCMPREGDGTLPLGRVFVSKADADDWEHPMFIPMRDHPVVIPDDDAAEDAATAPAWRCTSCGGVFSRDRMARITIAAGMRRPLPRSEMLSARFGAASLLDVARWAESNSIGGEMEFSIIHKLKGSDDVKFAPGGAAEGQLLHIPAIINELAALVGTSHTSVAVLRLLRLKTALQGVFLQIKDPAKKPPCGQVAAVVRRLLCVRQGSAAAAMPASALLAAEVASLAATLRRGKRLMAMRIMLEHLTCVMDSLGGFEDPNIARCVAFCQNLAAALTACCAHANPPVCAAQAGA